MLLAQSFSGLCLVDKLTRYREVFTKVCLNVCRAVNHPLSAQLVFVWVCRHPVWALWLSDRTPRRREERRRARALGRDWWGGSGGGCSGIWRNGTPTMVCLLSEPLQSYHLVDKPDLFLGWSGLRAGLGFRKPRESRPNMPLPCRPLSLSSPL